MLLAWLVSELPIMSLPCFFPRTFSCCYAREGTKLEGTGIPTRDQVLSAYCSISQNHLSTMKQQQPTVHKATYDEAKEWAGFYLTFLFFKNCVIVHGVAQRALSGVASSAVAHKVAKMLPEMLRLTWMIWNKYPPPTDKQHGNSKL